MAELVDLYPTLAELCGLQPPRHLMGKSLVLILRDPTAAVRETALTTFDTLDRVHRDKPPRPPTVGYSIRTERWRYTQWGSEGQFGAELYDHWNDPKEFDNLALAPSERGTWRVCGSYSRSTWRERPVLLSSRKHAADDDS